MDKVQQAVAAGGGKPQITPDMLRSSQTITCDCGGMVFMEKLFFKKISAIIAPSGREEVAPMPIIICEACGKVPSAFDTNDVLPKEIKAVKKKREIPNVPPKDLEKLQEGKD